MKKSSVEYMEGQELDTEFLRSGFDEELEKARNKEAEGKEEHYGRATFIAARSSELGIKMEIDDQLWSDMKTKGYDFKKENDDAWGMTFMAGYLKEIDSERFEELKESFEDSQELVGKKMKKRIADARKNPKCWKDFFAMAEHLVNLESEIMNLDELKIENEMEEEIKQCLKKYEDNPVEYLETVHAIEKVSPGIHERINLDKGKVKDMMGKAKEAAEEARKNRKTWKYSLIMRNIRKVQNEVLK